MLKLSMETRFVGLQDGTKIPDTKVFPRGHLDAVFWTDIFRHYTNFGIVLDNQYIVVDFDADHEEREILEKRLPQTWQQKTPKGMHYLFTIPPGWTGKNKKLRASDGIFLGDLKCRGYIVGPTSQVNGVSYKLITDVPPQIAPDWLLKLATDDSRGLSGQSGPEFDVLPDGSRDDALYAMGSLARKLGFSEIGIRAVLDGIVSSGAIEQPEGREIEGRDIERLARSAARHDSEYENFQVLDRAVIPGDAVELVRPVTKWWLYGFVPRGELVTMYGRGGIGKSTFAAWITSEVTKRDENALILTVEEPFERFLFKTVLSGGERSRVYTLQNSSSWQFPRDAEAFKARVLETGAKFVFFDSINNHFEALPGLNAADRTRKALSPLAEIAIQNDVTILCNFHENKSGEYLGSVEMANVARVMLQFTRKQNGSLICKVDKTNKKTPGYKLKFSAKEVLAQDPHSGAIQQEEDEDGTIGPESFIITNTPEKLFGSSDEDELDDLPEFVDLSTLEEPAENRNRRIYEAITLEGMSQRAAAEHFGLSKTGIFKIIEKFKS